MKPNGKRRQNWVSFHNGVAEITDTMRIPNEAASMLLYGLCATGNVRCLNDQLDFIDPDECTLTEFSAAGAFIAVNDLRHFLAEWSSAPQPSLINVEIAKRLPRRIPWKQFCNEIRDACNGWRGPGKHQMTGKTKDEEFEERLAASEKRVAELEAKLRGEPPRRQTPEPHKPYDPTANFGIATFRCPSNGRRCHRQIDGRLAQRRTQTQPRNRHVSGATHERRERPCANPTGFRLG
jgi:hypothetical protein